MREKTPLVRASRVSPHGFADGPSLRLIRACSASLSAARPAKDTGTALTAETLFSASDSYVKQRV